MTLANIDMTKVFVFFNDPCILENAFYSEAVIPQRTVK